MVDTVNLIETGMRGESTADVARRVYGLGSVTDQAALEYAIRMATSGDVLTANQAAANALAAQAVATLAASQSAANRDIVSVLAGISLTFNTYAAANAAISAIAANAYVQVLVDETHSGNRSIYQKQSGALVFIVNSSGSADLANRTDLAKGAALVGYRYSTVTGRLDLAARRPRRIFARIEAAISGTATALRWVALGDSLAAVKIQHLMPLIDRMMGGSNPNGINYAGLASNMGTVSAGGDLAGSTATGTVTQETTRFDLWPTGIVAVYQPGSTQLFVQIGSAPRFSRIRAFYIKEPGAGTIAWTIGGVAQAGVDASLAAGSTPTLGVLEFTQTFGQATAQLVVSGAGPVRSLFVHTENTAASGADYYTGMAVGGLLLANATSTTSGMAIWQSALSTIAPDAVSFEMNDDFANNGDGASSTAFGKLATMLDAVAPFADKIIIGSTPRSANDFVKENARSWLADQCASRGASWFYVDSYAPFGSYADMNALFPGGDGEHPTGPASLYGALDLFDRIGLNNMAVGFLPQPVRAMGQASALGSGTTFGGNSFTNGSLIVAGGSGLSDWAIYLGPTNPTRSISIGGASPATAPFNVSLNTALNPNVLFGSWDWGNVGNVRKFDLSTSSGKEFHRFRKTDTSSGYANVQVQVIWPTPMTATQAAAEIAANSQVGAILNVSDGFNAMGAGAYRAGGAGSGDFRKLLEASAWTASTGGPAGSDGYFSVVANGATKKLYTYP